MVTTRSRQEIEAINPRTGWFARNLDDDHGRVWDYLGGGLVSWDWTDHFIEAFVGDARIFERDYGTSHKKVLEQAMEAVERGVHR